MYLCESGQNIAANEENPCTFEEWLSVMIPRTQNSADARSSMQFDILSSNHLPLNITSGRACKM